MSTQGEAKAISELLAVIHRDGGHYQAERGTELAALDAQIKVLEYRAQIAILSAKLANSFNKRGQLTQERNQLRETIAALQSDFKELGERE